MGRQEHVLDIGSKSVAASFEQSMGWLEASNSKTFKKLSASPAFSPPLEKKNQKS
jgi:hypothetical protein